MGPRGNSDHFPEDHELESLRAYIEQEKTHEQLAEVDVFAAPENNEPQWSDKVKSFALSKGIIGSTADVELTEERLAEAWQGMLVAYAERVERIENRFKTVWRTNWAQTAKESAYEHLNNWDAETVLTLKTDIDNGTLKLQLMSSEKKTKIIDATPPGESFRPTWTFDAALSEANRGPRPPFTELDGQRAKEWLIGYLRAAATHMADPSKLKVDH
jgi:hypothetical protein